MSTPTVDKEPTAMSLQRRRLITGVLTLPVFFLVFLPAVFLGAFHSPTPHEMKVAVIGDSAAANTAAGQLAVTAGDALQVSRVPNADTAITQVRDLDVRAAYDPVTADLYVASAGGMQATTAAETIFSQVASASGATVHKHDVVPLPSSDPAGVSALYIGIGAIVGGFLSGLIIGLAGAKLATGWQVATMVGMSAVVAGIETLYGWVVFDIFPGNALGGFGMLFALALVSGLVTLGGMKIIGPAMVMVSILVLVLLGITSSGLAVQLDLTPGFYDAMHQILPTARGLSGLRNVIYFGGHGITGDLIVLGVWAAIGAVLLALTWRKREIPGAAALQPPPAEEPVIERESVASAPA
jgi:hypothetical protein